MENVPEVIGTGNIEHFKKWELRLRQFGYSNFVEVLNGKDFGIPQNRKRCFMVSILGNWHYSFPCKIPLKYHLKDFLDKNVDDKYYLSEKMISYITATNDKWTGNNIAAVINRDIGCTINTAPTQRRCDASNYIADDLPENTDLRKKDKIEVLGNYGNGHHAKDIYDSENLSPTITTGNHGLGHCVAIKENDKKGYKIATPGDGINISTRMHHQRGNVQKQSCQTLTCQGGGEYRSNN